MVIRSKSRRRNIRHVSRIDGNSLMQGPHHVAQKFTRMTLSVGFVRNFLSSAAEIVSVVTRSASNFFFCAIWLLIFDFHLVEQPNDGVCGTATGFSASIASSASRASFVFHRSEEHTSELQSRPYL